MIRPRAGAPTGIVIGRPESLTSMTANQTVGLIHGNATADIVAKVQCNLNDKVIRHIVDMPDC